MMDKMQSDWTPAEVFPPGDFVREEMEERGWAQEDLAEILGTNVRLVNELLAGRRAVNTDTARGLAEAFGTSAEIWLNLEAVYQLHKRSRGKQSAGAVRKRADLFSKAPVREMVRRGWIEGSDNPDVIEARLLEFFGTDSLDDPPKAWSHAARKASTYSAMSPSETVWLCRAAQLGRAVDAPKFTEARFKKALAHLRNLYAHAEEIRHVPRTLAEAGIRFVIVEHMKGTKIDGACLWLAKDAPVVALSMRYGRIDWFWFTLMHELGHVAAGDGKGAAPPIDVNLVGQRGAKDEDRPSFELAADAFAQRALVDPEQLQDFIDRTGPLYSKKSIRGFAIRCGIHPGIVVGQLQHIGQVGWTHFRDMLEQARGHILDAAITDGWGHVVAIGGQEK